jgi:hypothetical protein
MTKMGCSKIKTTAMEVFIRNGWRFGNRITFYMLFWGTFPSSFLIETLFLRLRGPLCLCV